MPFAPTLLLELESGLRALETGALPPDGYKFEHRLRALVREMVTEVELPELISALTCDGSSQTAPERYALVQVLASSVAPLRYPWTQTLDICDTHWPCWGYPYRKAAADALSRDEFDRASDYLERANRYSRVADWKLMDVYQQLREAAQRRQHLRTEERCLQWMSRHKYTVSNFSQLVDFARRHSDLRLQEEAVHRWLVAFGSTPDTWPVEDDLLDLSSAGNLCAHVNQVRARGISQPHDFRFWNDSALRYFRRSLDIAGKDKDHFYVRIRISEACAQTIRFADVQTMSDVELGRWITLARSVALDLVERARRSGGAKDNLYGASRNLAAVYAGAARRARARGAHADAIADLVAQADAHYRAMIHYATPKSKHVASRFRSEFLYENIDCEIASRALEDSSIGAVAHAAARFRTGRVDEAVEILCSHATDTKDPRARSGSAQLLAHYLDLASRPGRSLAESSRRRGTETLQRMVPVFVSACRHAILRGNLVHAQRYLDVAFRYEQPPSLNLLHLRARIQLKTGFPPDRVLEQLSPYVLHEGGVGAPADDHLRAIFLQALARCDQVLINPDRAWQLVEKSRGAAAEGGRAGDEDAFSVYDVLLWELRSGQHDSWPLHLLRARSSFPGDPRWAQLPAQAYEVVPNEADALVLAVLSNAAADAPARPWIADVLARLPDSFFSQPELLRNLASALGAWSDISEADARALTRALGDRLSGSLLSSWLEGCDVTSRMTRTISWIEDWVPSSHRIHCWTQLLGASRAQLEATLVSKHQRRVDAFGLQIASLKEPSTTTIVNALDAFIVDLRELSAVESQPPLPQLVATIVEHCVTGALRYRPWNPDPHFWPQLERLVASLGPDAYHGDAISSAWLRVQAAISRVVDGRLVPVIRSQFHRLKNEITRGEGNEPLWRDRIEAVVTRAHGFLALHRWPQLERLDLRDILCDTVYRPPFAISARRAGRNLAVYAFRPENAVAVIGDRALLIELTTELFRNALKAVERSGSPGWIRGEVSSDGKTAIVSVRDSGGGCPSYRINALNASADDRAVASDVSTGFGHRFCSRIAALHDGQLQYSFRRERDFGLCAELRLPTAAAELRGGTN